MHPQDFIMSGSVRVPSPGEWFYLLHHITGKVVTQTGHAIDLSEPSANTDSQLWTIRSASSAGTYGFQNRRSNQWLWSNSSPFRPEHSGVAGYGSAFHLESVNQSSNIFLMMWQGNIFPTGEPAGEEANREAVGECNEKEAGRLSHSSVVNPFNDYRYSFLVTDKKNQLPWERIEFDLVAGRVHGSEPIVMGSQTVENNTDVAQTQSLQFALSVERSSSFEHTHGFSIMVGTAGKVGIPFVAEGSVKLEASTTHDWTWGSTQTRKSEVTIKFDVVAPPRSVVTATGMITRSVLDVPWTIYTVSPTSQVEISSHGIYKGVDFWDVRSRINQHSLVAGIADKNYLVPVQVTSKTISVHYEPDKTSK